jgi:hypothetical protein
MGSVAVEIGGVMGAVVVQMTAEHRSEELEIRPVGEEWMGTHTGIRPSGVASAPGLFAVFGSLKEGSYEMRIKGTDGPSNVLEVRGGELQQIEWKNPLFFERVEPDRYPVDASFDSTRRNESRLVSDHD